MEQQHHLQMSQEVASKQIGQTMREVSRERSAALASQRQMASLSQTLKATLDQATMMVREQENERQVAQQRLLESLTNVENHVGDVWNQLEESVSKLPETTRTAKPCRLITIGNGSDAVAAQLNFSVPSMRL